MYFTGDLYQGALCSVVDVSRLMKIINFTRNLSDIETLTKTRTVTLFFCMFFFWSKKVVVII